MSLHQLFLSLQVPVSSARWAFLCQVGLGGQRAHFSHINSTNVSLIERYQSWGGHKEVRQTHRRKRNAGGKEFVVSHLCHSCANTPPLKSWAPLPAPPAPLSSQLPPLHPQHPSSIFHPIPGGAAHLGLTLCFPSSLCVSMSLTPSLSLSDTSPCRRPSLSTAL